MILISLIKYNFFINNQGIHTSSAKGTMKRNCHQDWLMGKCGRSQDAAGIFPRGKTVFKQLLSARNANLPEY